MNSVERFQDMVIELEQIRQATGTLKTETMQEPYCAEVIGDMTELVIEEPGVAEFYAGVLKEYRKTNPRRIEGPIDVISGRIVLMNDLELISDGQSEKMLAEVASGSAVHKEAVFFFRMFKDVLKPEQIAVPRPKRKNPKPKPVFEEQAVDDAAEIEEVSGLESKWQALFTKPGVETEKLDEIFIPRLLDTDKEWEGKECDRLFDRYQHHKLNSLKTRYERDFAGFKGDLPDRLYFDGSSKDDFSESGWFYAHMRRFPLLDGKQHEKVLREKLQAGLDAFEQLESGDFKPRQRRLLEETAIIGAGAYETMYECNLRWVAKLANGFKTTKTCGTTDLISAGCLGLRRAIQLFDPEKGFKFSTYSAYWIRQHMQRRQAGIAYDVYLPSQALLECRKIGRFVQDFEEQKDRYPTDQELEKEGFKPDCIFVYHNLMGDKTLSLDKPFGEDDTATLYQVLPDGDRKDFTAGITENERIDFLAELVEDSGIQPRERIALSLREGVILPGVDYSEPISLEKTDASTLGELLSEIRSGRVEPTLDDIGAITGLTRERARQIIVSTNRSILNTRSVGVMAERLLMTEEEKKVLHSYVERRNLVSVGRPSEIAVKVVQEKVRSVVELLGLIDCDLNSAVEQTLSVMEGNFNIQDATLPKIEKWLRIRFGLEQTDRLPIGAAESRLEYGLGSDVASNADSIFLGILAGTWGKLPRELQEAA